MDPLSITASVIAVIQLSSEVVGFIGAATGATKDRKRLREEVLACDRILQDLKDEADDSEEGLAWSQTIKALEGSDAPLGRLSVALKLVKAKLEPQDGGKKIRTSLRWPFEGKEVNKIIGAMEREKALLNLALNNDHRRLTQSLTKVSKENARQLLELTRVVDESSIQNESQFAAVRNDLAGIENSHTRLKEGVDRLSKRNDREEDEKQKRDIIKWLTPINYTSQQSDFINRRTPGTGQWLLHSAEFKVWVNTDKRTLFCPGIPGAGKTILTSIVVQELYERFRSKDAKDYSNMGIAYLYFNFRRQHEQTAYGILASLLKQLCQETASLPTVVVDLYEKHKDRGTQPSSTEVANTLQDVVREFSRVFIVIDALDECQTSGGCRAEVLTEVLKLEANVFATTRHVPEIMERFGHSITLEIRARDEDVERYLDSHMPHLPGFVAGNRSLQEEIKSTITRLVQGMFLLAQLYIDSLVGKRSPKAIRIAMAELPNGSTSKVYDFAYDHAMERIEGQVADQEQLAKQVISWIVCAERPLTARELQHALTIEANEPKLDEENTPQLEDMISVCAGLVALDEKSGIIRLVHYTTQEYFDRTQKKWLPDAQTELMTKCVTYLLYSVFESGRCGSIAAYLARVRRNPLFEYAALHWGHHTRKSLSICPEVKRFLESPEKLEACCQVLRFEKNLGRSQFHAATRMTRLHLAAYFGLLELVDDFLIENDPFDTPDSNFITPLGWAARNDHPMVIRRLLIEYGVRQELHTDVCRSLVSWLRRVRLPPIFWAAKNGNEQLTKFLLAADGIDIDIPGIDGRTPLSWAAGLGHANVVRLLLETDRVEVNKTDLNARGPISWAAHFGHVNIVKLLLNTNKVRVDERDWNGQTPMSLAAYWGHSDVVKLLLKNSVAEVDAEDKSGRTPLFYAAWFGRKEIVKLLLKTGKADVNKADSFGMTPLAWAARERHERTVKLILETGRVDFDRKRSNIRTALSYAVEEAHLGIVKLLVQYGAKVEEEWVFEGLSKWGIRKRVALLESEVATTISNNECKLARQDSWGENALIMASRWGLLSTARRLLDKGVLPDAIGGLGQPLLSWAVKNNRLLLVELLAQKGANMNIKDPDGWTPLWHAVQSGNSTTVNCLLDLKASPNVDGCGKLMVRWAAREGSIEIVRLLLTFEGLEASLKDEWSGIALVAAAKSGQVGVVKLLFEMGVDVDSQDEKGKTSLSHAISCKHDAIVQLFQDYTSRKLAYDIEGLTIA